MDSHAALQTLISTLTVVGSSLGAFFGVKIQIARLEERMEERSRHAERERSEIRDRLSRLEDRLIRSSRRTD